MLLKGKVAIVTGSCNGIGKAICDAFTSNEVTVIGIDVVEDRGNVLKPL